MLPFDYDTFAAYKGIVEAGVTNIHTGKAEYLKVPQSIDMKDTLVASCSLPILFQPVKIGRHYYLDGGIADSIPLVHAMEKGYRKNVVILTRNKGYRKKKPGKSTPVYVAAFRHYPELLNTLYNRYRNYNRTLELIEKWEQEGHIFVIRPEMPAVGRAETNKDKLMDFYQHGYEVMKERYEELQAYLHS